MDADGDLSRRWPVEPVNSDVRERSEMSLEGR